jgi:hypothetical protein
MINPNTKRFRCFTLAQWSSAEHSTEINMHSSKYSSATSLAANGAKKKIGVSCRCF